MKYSYTSIGARVLRVIRQTPECATIVRAVDHMSRISTVLYTSSYDSSYELVLFYWRGRPSLALRLL